MQIVKSDLQLLARNIEPYSNELTLLQELKTEFMSGTVRYDTICKEYLDFLSRTNTAEGMDEVHKLSGEMQDFTQFVETENEETLDIEGKKAFIEEKRSIESAKVERKKADIEADLDLLSRQKEAAAVEAEANALQNECHENMSKVLPDQPPLVNRQTLVLRINYQQQKGNLMTFEAVKQTLLKEKKMREVKVWILRNKMWGLWGNRSPYSTAHKKNREQRSTEPSDYDEENKVQTPIQSACTQICMDKFSGKSCAKIMPVEVYRSDNPDRRLKVYALMDDQSNRTLGKSELFDYFGSTSVFDFILSTCSGKSQASG
ncbi:Hypothetical predicted protein [Mytilus galloprovincialis]|uniref:Uncharacterized protein n=1 Tax=Mytilus galloprovincialis TaxID=29158 RepID=A0A8B6FJD5_MYTGA|nr:Hypothetical predicted protein [Mytilus galloprovincialis]